MARMTMIEAVRSAMDVSMARDDNVVVFGEDVGYFGGVFRSTQGLQAKYGRTRCFDTPISESGIVGTAIGMAAYGLKPCVEIQFADYMYPAYDQLTQRRRAFATVPTAISPARSSCACRQAAVSSAARRTARARRRFLPMSAG